MPVNLYRVDSDEDKRPKVCMYVVTNVHYMYAYICTYGLFLHVCVCVCACVCVQGMYVCHVRDSL